jgi:hypothetical protein
MAGNAAFYSTARATAELGWDPAVDHPDVAAGERSRLPANDPAASA